MDISIKATAGEFNYRVAAMIVHEAHILVMQDEGIPHDYLPGGRVHVHEPAEAALSRELREELDIDIPPHQLTFIAESFFTIDSTRYHEMCLYFLMDAPPELLARGNQFTRVEGNEIHHFRWVRFEELRHLSFYPIFLKERIFTLPDHPEFITHPS